MGNERILIVDDEINILNMADGILSRSGFVIEKAESAEKAMSIIDKRTFNLLLTDIKMPGMSGMDLLKYYRNYEHDGAAVIMTGHGTLDTAIEAIGTGTHGFVMKPFTREELLRSVNKALDKVRLLRERHRIRTVMPLFETSKVLMQKYNPDDLLETVIATAQSEANADMVSVMLKDDDNLAICASVGMGRSFVGKVRVKIGEGIIGRAAEKGGAVLIGKNNVSSLFNGEMHGRDFLSALIIPMKVNDELVGMLNLIKGVKNQTPFNESDMDFMSVLAGQAAAAMKNARLVSELEALFMGTVKTLSSAIDAKSNWTAGHSARVTAYAVAIGKAMGVSHEEMKALELAGILHDIGKIGTSEKVLDKPGKLNDEEIMMIRKHPEKGGTLLSHIKHLNHLIPIVRHHHEYYDGTGYPDGLRGEDIPLSARILAVADTFDAMKADRPYRNGRSRQFIIDELKRCCGTQFDPDVVSAFLTCINDGSAFDTDNEDAKKPNSLFGGNSEYCTNSNRGILP